MGLTGEMRKLLMMNGIGQIIFSYIGIFINLYIWEESKSLFDVSLYNFFTYLVWGAGFTLGAHLLTRRSMRIVYTLSALSGLTVFLLLSFLHLEQRLVWIALIGSVVGLTFGLFYAGQNLGISLSGKAKEFGRYFSVVVVMQQVVSVSVPILSALVIMEFGYSGSFLLMLAIVGCMLGAALLVPNLSLAEVREREGDWFRGIGYFRVFHTASSKWLQAAFIAAGLFFQFQNLFILIFTFSISQDKLIIALLNAAYTCAAFAALYVHRRVRFGEDAWMFIGCSVVALGFLAALVPYSPMLVLSNVLSVLGMYYFGVNWQTKVYRSMNALPPMQKLRVLVWRENTLCAARCVMLLLLFALPDIRGGWFAVIVVLTIGFMFAVPLCLRRSEALAVKQQTNAAAVTEGMSSSV